MNFNEDGNLLGRVLALALLIAAVAGVRRLTCVEECPMGGAGCAFHSERHAPSPASNVDKTSR